MDNTTDKANKRKRKNTPEMEAARKATREANAARRETKRDQQMEVRTLAIDSLRAVLNDPASTIQDRLRAVALLTEYK